MADWNRAVASPLPTRDEIFVDPRLLSQAPELAALTLLDVALEISARSLRAEHPTLGLDEPGPKPASLRRAQRVLSLICPLQHAVYRYREAVIAVTSAPAKQDDDLPF